MNRADILDLAKEIITKDRNTTYGPPEDIFATIAEYWTVLFGFPVEPLDVAMALALLKMVRAKNNPQHMDSFIDLVGYSAIAGELAARAAARREREREELSVSSISTQ